MSVCLCIYVRTRARARVYVSCVQRIEASGCSRPVAPYDLRALTLARISSCNIGHGGRICIYCLSVIMCVCMYACICSMRIPCTYICAGSVSSVIIIDCPRSSQRRGPRHRTPFHEENPSDKPRLRLTNENGEGAEAPQEDFDRNVLVGFSSHEEEGSS